MVSSKRQHQEFIKLMIWLIAGASIISGGISFYVVRNARKSDLIRSFAEEKINLLNEELEKRVGHRTKELNALLDEKEVLLREIHHRVKNNLTVIVSMLDMQADGEDSAHTVEVLQDSYRRVMLMGQIHESLHRQDNLNAINAREFLNTLANKTKAFGGAISEKISYNVNVDEIDIDVDHANAYGQIISELISNAHKHGFTNGNPGNIDISLRQKNGGEIELIVADDGKGLPEDFDLEQTDSLGLKLVRSLSVKFGGKIKIDGSGGTRIQINFPEHPS